MKNLKLMLFLGLVCSFYCYSTAFSQEKKPKPRAEFVLEEIVVTAERRETNAQDTPVAVSAWDSDMLDEQNIQGSLDFQMRMPSTFVGGSTITIRGVGRSSARLGIDPGVGLFADGMYNSEANAWLADLWDVERIENVRGPQSTLYGRSTIGGAINIITKKPTREWSGQLKATFGNYEKREFYAAFGGPTKFIDNLMYRVALVDKWYGGHQKNILWEDEYQGTVDMWRVTLKLLYEPTDYLSFYFKYDVSDNKQRPRATAILDEWNTTDENIWFDDINQGSNFQNQFYGLTMTNPTLKNRYEVAQNTPGHYSLDSSQVDLTTTLDIGNFTFQHLTFYRDWANSNASDYDDGPSWDASKVLYIIQDRYEWSQELQVIYGGENSPFSIFGGLYYYQRHANMMNDLLYLGNDYWEHYFPFTHPILPDFTPHPNHSNYINTMYIDDISKAIYAKIDYPIINTLTLSIGARYAEDSKKGPDTLYYQYALPSALFGVPGPIKNQAASDYFGYDVYYQRNTFPWLHTDSSYHNRTWEEFLYNAGADFKPSENALLYAKFGRGYKPGGFSLGSVQDADFDAEYVKAYEVGWKQFWLDNRFSTSLGGYYYDYEGLQMTAQLEHVTMTYNAANSENYGFEFEGSGYLTEHLLTSLSYSYMSTEFKEFDKQYDQYEPEKGYQDLNGNPLPWSPEHKVSINATYTIPTDIGDFLGHALYFWQSEVYTSHFAIPERLADAYDRVDAELMWNSPNYIWRVTLWIKNALDETTITSQSLSGPSNNFYNTASFAPPRTFGIDISYKW